MVNFRWQGLIKSCSRIYISFIELKTNCAKLKVTKIVERTNIRTRFGKEKVPFHFFAMKYIYNEKKTVGLWLEKHRNCANFRRGRLSKPPTSPLSKTFSFHSPFEKVVNMLLVRHIVRYKRPIFRRIFHGRNHVPFKHIHYRFFS